MNSQNKIISHLVNLDTKQEGVSDSWLDIWRKNMGTVCLVLQSEQKDKHSADAK